MDERLSLQYILAKSPLYERIPLSDELPTLEFLIALETTRNSADLHCVECRRQSVFHVVWPEDHIKRRKEDFRRAGSPYIADQQFGGAPRALGREDSSRLDTYFPEKHIILLTAYCMRNNRHIVNAALMIHNRELQKIGQHPSFADLDDPEIEKYRQVLPDYSELSRAIRLASVNVGIGSYVYLRRIIERLIEEAHAAKTSEATWNEGAYQQARVLERVDMLSDRLPSFFHENKELYSILSKGIHELTEEECLRYFGVIKIGIQLILDQKLEQKERDKRVADASKEIRRAKGELSK